MKSTGVFRRIDNLGRIVIPKEIRQSLRLNNGDNIEFLLNNEDIVLKRYSVFKNVNEYLQNICNIFYKNFKIGIIICDSNSIIANSTNNKEYINDLKISKEMVDLINKSYRCNNELFSIPIDSEGINSEKILVNSIIVNGDCVGLVSLLVTKTDSQLMDLLYFITDLISKYIE